MSKKKIFLASPISGFQNEQKYISYRESVLAFIDALSGTFEVHSEIQEIQGMDSYDTCEESVRKDFQAIDEADIFVLLHPHRMQSSTLIELGYACAKKKKLLLIGAKDALPYMALGLNKPNFDSAFLYSDNIDMNTINKAVLLLKKLVE